MMKQDKVFVGIFLVIVFGVFLVLPIKFVLVYSGVVKQESNDNWVVYEEKEEHNIIDKLENKINRIKNGVENRVTNYFPMYNTINEVYQNVNFNANKLFFTRVPLKENSDGEYVFYNKKYDFFYTENNYEKLELDKRVDKQIDFFNSLAKSGLDISIYIPTKYELTTLTSNNLRNYINYFQESLDKDIKLKWMDISNILEYKNYFYQTDHHWTSYGAMDGYYDIVSMLGVSPVSNLDVVKKNDRKYYGSYAKSTLNDIINDYILDFDIELDYDVYVNGISADELFKPRKIRLDRSYKYYDYYVSYFNGQYGNVLYDYHDDSKDNLLIMSDSYAWQIDYIIASSFNKTHVINLRYDEYKNKNFDLSNYVKSNDIDKVLFLYQGESILFDQYNYDFESRVK